MLRALPTVRNASLAVFPREHACGESQKLNLSEKTECSNKSLPDITVQGFDYAKKLKFSGSRLEPETLQGYGCAMQLATDKGGA